MLRILGLFAQRDLLPGQVRMNVIDQTIWVALTIDGLTEHQAQVIAAKMRELIDTHVVDVAWTHETSGDAARHSASRLVHV